MITLLLLACASPEAPSTHDTGSETVLVVVDSQTQALSATVSATTAWSTSPAVQVGAALNVVLADDATLAYAEDGTIPAEDTGAVAPPSGESDCVAWAVEEGDLVLTYACPSVQGTVRLHHDRGGPTTVTFAEGFVVGDTPIAGSLALSAELRSGEYTAAGDLAVGDVVLAFDLDLRVEEGLALSGEASAELEAYDLVCEVELGESEEPLVWTGGCTCPSSGTLGASASAVVEQLTLDLDDVIQPTNGADNYPPIDVPVDPARVEIDMATTFVAACGDPAVDLSADDVTVTVQTADVEAGLAEACDAGLVDPADCTLAERALAALPESLSVDLPAAALVEAAEPTAEAAAAALCQGAASDEVSE